MQTARVPWAVLATPNLSSKFCDGRRGDQAHLARVGQDHLRPVAEKADKPGHAYPLSFQRRFRSASELCPIGPVNHRGQYTVRIGLIRVNHGDECWVSAIINFISGPGDHTTNSGGMSDLAHNMVRVTVTALADRAQRLSAADANATFALYIVSSTGWGRSIHVAKRLRSR